ncbi:GNAT family N-acetyltransferase [Paraburkholderia sp. J11-2]|uniref:GNAT family N-acetyltransferase n=1 Tax=Paraburkholderia sp. J11-2 TaxID=2805431 RepID=UPI002AB5F350|nr:GNAT family N-acetyltransferase [Paraburkholderia sp. J11-2]
MLDVLATKSTGSTPALDNTVWHALTGRQRHLAVGNDGALRYAPAIAPFAALMDTTPESFDALRGLIEEHAPVALTTLDAVHPPAGFALIRHATLLQMVWQGEPHAPTQEHVRLTERDVPEMLALAAATQPGPFGPRTIEFGGYVGVRKAGKLVAMAGERMKVEGHTEISAVCVDAAFRGQGLATGLMKLLVASICARGETPFLHVLTSNHGAIAIYRALGFGERREMHLTVLGLAP